MTTPQPARPPAEPSDAELHALGSVGYVIAALGHVQAETGKHPALSSLAVALIADSLLSQGVRFPDMSIIGGAGAATPADPHDGYSCAEIETRLEDLEGQVNDASMALSRAGHDVDIRHLGRSVRAALTGIPRERQDEPRVCTCTPTMRAEQRRCEGCIAEDAEWPSRGAVCCDELNPDTGYRCRRTPVHDAGKSIRKHVQIDKLGQVDWWITPARALLSGGEQT